MATVKQPSWMPTNKLTVSMLAGAAMGFIEPVWSHFIPMFADPRIFMLVQYGVAFAIGYMVKDHPNVISNDESE